MNYRKRNSNAWNQKNLDYEIETSVNLGWNGTRAKPWNQKNLDYEIETRLRDGETGTPSRLETKRTSITRLKPDCETPDYETILTWNQKNLDYEIETYS